MTPTICGILEQSNQYTELAILPTELTSQILATFVHEEMDWCHRWPEGGMPRIDRDWARLSAVYVGLSLQTSTSAYMTL